MRLWPESKIKHIASLLSLHGCCLSNKQKWGRVEYATANSVSFPTINVFQFLADGCYHLIANGLCDPGDVGMPRFQQGFCLISWVFFPVFLWVGHWFLPDLFPNSFQDLPRLYFGFSFFHSNVSSGFWPGKRGKKMKANSIDSPLHVMAKQPLSGAECGSGSSLQGKGYSCLQPCVSGVNSSRDLFVFLQESHSVMLRLWVFICLGVVVFWLFFFS